MYVRGITLFRLRYHRSILSDKQTHIKISKAESLVATLHGVCCDRTRGHQSLCLMVLLSEKRVESILQRMRARGFLFLCQLQFTRTT